MKKWMWIPLGLLALDAVAMLMAAPLARFFGLDNEAIGSGAPIIRFLGMVFGAVAVILLLAAWNLSIRRELPK